MMICRKQWERDAERIGYEYILDLLTLEEAIKELQKFGFNHFEAGEYLDSCRPGGCYV